MSNRPTSTEARIDQVLEALRTTEPPIGLEARIAARIAQATEARTLTASPFAVKNGRSPASFFAVILNVVKDPRISFAEAKLYTAAAIALTLLITITTLHHKPHTIAQSKPIPNKPYEPMHPATLAQASSLGNIRVPQASSLGNTPVPQASSLGNIRVPQASSLGNTRVPQASSLGNTPVPQASSLGNIRVPQGFSLGSHTASQRAGVLTPASSQQPTDPDTIALAETLAPSRPAPPMPLTQQERLMLNVLRSGDQQEIAALNPTERDALFARDQAAFQDFFAPPTPAPNTGDKE